MAEGRICSAVKNRGDFVALIPAALPILEIGPFFTPAFRRPGANVYYLDCLSTGALKIRAAAIDGASVDSIPEIDYVWSGQHYADLVGRKFSVIFSSHNIEHQPCLVSHLRELESVLEEDGAVFLVIPDKRYCFDHFFPEASLPEIAEAWLTGRTRHRPKDVLEHHFYFAHNDPIRHWRGDHGANPALSPLGSGRNKAFLGELEKLRSSDEYMDVHAWKFTPVGFRMRIEDLHNLKLTRLRVAKVYPTVRNSNEFYAVLIIGRGSS
jgi:hypothetical protein